MSANEWLNFISSIESKAQIDKVPEGFKTILQISIEIKKPRSTVREKCIAGIEKGKIETKEFRIKSGTTIKAVRHYKIIK